MHQIETFTSGRACRAIATGASLIASGRVPTINATCSTLLALYRAAAESATLSNLFMEKGVDDHCADTVLPEPDTVGLSAEAGLAAERAARNEAGGKTEPEQSGNWLTVDVENPAVPINQRGGSSGQQHFLPVGVE